MQYKKRVHIFLPLIEISINQQCLWYRSYKPRQPSQHMFTTKSSVEIKCGTNELVNTSWDSPWAKW